MFVYLQDLLFLVTVTCNLWSSFVKVPAINQAYDQRLSEVLANFSLAADQHYCNYLYTALVSSDAERDFHSYRNLTPVSTCQQRYTSVLCKYRSVRIRSVMDVFCSRFGLGHFLLSVTPGLSNKHMNVSAPGVWN